ncbi:MAG: SURF1 family protein [Actinomycetota bacterium]
MIRHVLALVVVVACLGLAVWQSQRLQDRKDDNARLSAQTRLPTVALETLLPSPGESRDSAYRRVTVRGTYDVEQEVVLQSRSFKNRPGNHLLTPLRASSGTAVIVDRGWVPIVINRPGAPLALPPDGEVELTGVLLPGEAKGLFGVSDPPPGVVTAIPRVDLERLNEQLPYSVPGVYLRLEEQKPPAADLPEPVPLAALSEGPHLEYALQWGFFALVSAIVYAALIRKESRRSRKQRELTQTAPSG